MEIRANSGGWGQHWEIPIGGWYGKERVGGLYTLVPVKERG